MDIVIITILLLIILIIFIICLIKYGYVIYEGFSSDEAIQNVASLYNQSSLTVGNFTSTGTTTLGNATVNNLNATAGTIGTATSTNQTVNGTLNANVANVGGGLTANSANVTGALSANSATLGGTNINGILNVSEGIQGIVVNFANGWDAGQFLNIAKNYFSRNTPDGTTLRFFFINPNTGAGPNQNVWHALVVKLGQQLLLYEVQPEHNGVGNLWSGQANSNWRINL